MFIADNGNNVIRRVDAATGYIATIAGGGTSGLGDGGAATSAALWGPTAVAIDPKGNLFIADTFNNVIRKVDPLGAITTVAGGGNNPGTDGFGDGGPAVGSNLSAPTAVALDSSGNLYIADTGNNMIRKVDLTAGTITAVAGNGSRGFGNNGSVATDSSLSSPSGVAVDAANNVYIGDTANNVIRKVDAGTGLMSTIGGSGAPGFLGDGGNSLNAQLYMPMSITVDGPGNLYTADYGNNVVRKTSSSAAPLAFPSVAVGASSDPQTAFLSNIGNQALTLSTLAASSNFTWVSSASSSCAAQASVAAGTTCAIAVTFSPKTAGAATGSLNVVDNSLSNPASSQQIALGGVAVAVPQIALTAASVSFNSQTVGTSSTAQIVTVSNSGSAALTISSIGLSGANAADFAQSNNCPGSLASAAACAISIAFTPSATGSRTASINIVDNSASGTSHTIALTGTGTSCSYSLSQSLLTTGPSTLTGSLTVNTTAGCGWSASSNAAWLTITNGTSRTGSGNISYSVAANTSASTRTIAASVAGQPFIVTQTGVTPPSVISASPASGSNLTQTFTFTFSDPRGAQDFSIANVLINGSLDGRHACYLAYSAPSSVLYLVDDTGNNLLPSITLGGSGSVSNSQCTVSSAGSSATASGTTLTLAFKITFTAAFAGTKISYVGIRDAAQNSSGWQPVAVWTVPGATVTTPTSVVKMTPARGTGHSQTFAFTFADTKGWKDIGVVNFLMNLGLDGRNACYVAYSSPANMLYLVTDDGSNLVNTPLTGSGTLSNSQCTLNLTGSSAAGSGNNLTLTLAITFNPAFSGNKVFFAAARDTAGANSTGWQSIGSWMAQ